MPTGDRHPDPHGEEGDQPMLTRMLLRAISLAASIASMPALAQDETGAAPSGTRYAASASSPVGAAPACEAHQGEGADFLSSRCNAQTGADYGSHGGTQRRPDSQRAHVSAASRVGMVSPPGHVDS